MRLCRSRKGRHAIDDFGGSDLLQPRVTTVRQDAVREGETAVDLLLARMDGLNEPVRSVVLPTELVVRGSGEIRGPLVTA